MNDLLIYAARLQDAGITHLSVALFTQKDRKRMMRVGVVMPERASLEAKARWPVRDFDLCGIDSVLESLKDDLIYGDKVTAENVHAAITLHPHLRDDLNEWYADWLLHPMPTDEEIAAEAVDDGVLRRTNQYVKGLLRGFDAAREQERLQQQDRDDRSAAA